MSDYRISMENLQKANIPAKVGQVLMIKAPEPEGTQLRVQISKVENDHVIVSTVQQEPATQQPTAETGQRGQTTGQQAAAQKEQAGPTAPPQPQQSSQEAPESAGQQQAPQ